MLRYAGIAAMLLITLLALANLEITWKNGEFSLSMHLFGTARPGEDYYTKSQMRDLLKQVMDDSESRQTETNYLMMQQLLDTVEHDRLVDLRYVRSQSGCRPRQELMPNTAVSRQLSAVSYRAGDTMGKVT